MARGSVSHATRGVCHVVFREKPDEQVPTHSPIPRGWIPSPWAQRSRFCSTYALAISQAIEPTTPPTIKRSGRSVPTLRCERCVTLYSCFSPLRYPRRRWLELIVCSSFVGRHWLRQIRSSPSSPPVTNGMVRDFQCRDGAAKASLRSSSATT